MDYCDPCRRHLNGALACPGCGTSAEQLRTHAEQTDKRAGTGAGAVDVGGDSLYEGDNDDDEDPDDDEDEDGEDGEDEDGEGSRPDGPLPGGAAVGAGEAGAGTRRGPAVRAGGTGRPRRIVVGGVGCCSSPRGSCWRRVG